MSERICKKFTGSKHEHRSCCDDRKGFAGQGSQLLPIAGSVLIRNERRTAHGIADRNSHEDHGDIHDCSVDSHAFFFGKAKKLPVLQNGNKC